VLFRSEFDLSENGLLPGLVGADLADTETFEVYVSWDRSGEGTARHKISSKPASQPTQSGGILSSTADLGTGDGQYGVELAAFELPKGRWLRVNQELVLNRPDQTDGTLRIFIDGKLVLERTDMHLRSSAETTLRGVAVAGHVLGPDARYGGATEGAVSFTPFEVYW
jgi:hypothetical protein